MIESVLLIGLGNIGLKYDIDLPLEESFLSHAGNIRNTLKSNYVYGIDIDEKARSIFSKRYEWDSFERTNLLPKNFSPDLVVLATPSKKRLEQYNQVMNFQDSILLIEKPLCETENELEDIKGLFVNRTKSVFVNFHRRSSPSLVELKNELNQLGGKEKLSAFGFVTGNALSNVSHMVDLINFLLGNRNLVAGGGFSGEVWKFQGDSCEVYVHSLPTLYPTVFKLAIFSDKKLWEYDSNLGTLIESPIEQSATFKGEMNFSNSKTQKNTKDSEGLRFVYENLVDYANGRPYDLCKIDDAIGSMGLFFEKLPFRGLIE